MRRPRLEPGTLRSQAVRLYRLEMKLFLLSAQTLLDNVTLFVNHEMKIPTYHYTFNQYQHVRYTKHKTMHIIGQL